MSSSPGENITTLAEAAKSNQVTLEPLTDNSTYKIIKLRARWVDTEKKYDEKFRDWFRIVKFIIVVLQVYLIFVRPALPPKVEMEAAWVASSLFSL